MFYVKKLLVLQLKIVIFHSSKILKFLIIYIYFVNKNLYFNFCNCRVKHITSQLDVKTC